MKTVLLIEDDELCRAPAAERLRAEGWRVIEAEDGESGLALCEEYRPDVVLCDLLMPRGNGFQFCRSVRGNAQIAGTRIIVVTGRDFDADRRSALEAGADDYMVKPIDTGDLLRRLESVEHHDTAAPPPPAPAPEESRGGECEIRFWGVRGSIPTPGAPTVYYGGNTSCVEVRADGEIIVLDAGTGIRPLGLALEEEFGETPIRVTLLISHTHWDHIQGFPFFLPAYKKKNQVHILGCEGAKAELKATLAGQMESPYFPIALEQMPANIVIEELKDMDFSIGAVKASACYVNHPGVCVGYRLETSGGSVVYLPDNEPFGERGETCGRAAESAFPATMARKLVDFIAGADALIIDAQYDQAEYNCHVGWGHGCVDDVVALALDARVKRLFLFHHDPSHDDARVTAMVEKARALVQAGGGTLEVEAAREGAACKLVVES